MKSIVIGAVVLSLVPMTAYSDTIGVYDDPQGTECNISDVTDLMKEVYVVHKSSQGTTGAQWSAPKPACWTNASWLSDTAVWPVVVGDSQTGMRLAYGLCQTGAYLVTTIYYFVDGTSPACCQYPLLPHPDLPSGQVEVTDCNFNIQWGVGLTSTINGDETCPCGYPVPVEKMTWGKIKALFTE